MSNSFITIPCWAVFAVDLANDKVEFMALNKDKGKAESDARERAGCDRMLSSVSLATFNVGKGAKKIRTQIVSWLWETGLYGTDAEHVIQIIEEQVAGVVVHLAYEMDRQDRRKCDVKITEVNLKLPDPGDHPRLLAYCGLVLDGDFAVHDLKLVQGNSGLILSMPSRKNRDRCPDCRALNELKSRYCCMCGEPLPSFEEGWAQQFWEPDGRWKERVDVFHPLNNRARNWLQGEVAAAYDVRKHEQVPVMSGG